MFWWVELGLFSLECNEVSDSELWGVYGFGMALGRPSFNVQDYVPVFLDKYHGVSCTVTCWILGSSWFQCRYEDFCMGSCLLM